MSIKKVSDIEWEYEFACGDWNDTREIVATNDGLEIGGDLIPWEDIEKAKDAVMIR
jgi:hypothetical protein